MRSPDSFENLRVVVWGRGCQVQAAWQDFRVNEHIGFGTTDRVSRSCDPVTPLHFADSNCRNPEKILCWGLTETSHELWVLALPSAHVIRIEQMTFHGPFSGFRLPLEASRRTLPRTADRDTQRGRNRIRVLSGCTP
jgi:hypothetical protein